MSYRDITGGNASSNMDNSDLLAQSSSLFSSIPPATSSRSPRIQPSLTLFDASAILMDGPPGHAAISICPREWWQERPERTPLREEMWPNRLFSSLPPLQSISDLAPGSAPQLHQAPNQTNLLDLQDIFQPPSPMTVQHPHATGVLSAINQKLYLATCGDNPATQAKVYEEFVRLQSLMGEHRDLAVLDDPNSALWKCTLHPCGQKPQRQWDLAAHYLSKHAESTLKPWSCVCGKSYARNGDLRRHQRSCPECLSKPDNPIPNLAADCGPNHCPFPVIPAIGGSQRANGAQQTLLPPSVSSSATSPFNNASHFVQHSPAPTHVSPVSDVMAGSSNGMYRQFLPQQWSTPQTNVFYPASGAVPHPPPTNTRNGSSRGPYGGARRASNGNAGNHCNNGNGNDNGNGNVKDRVPIEVRRPVLKSGFEPLEKEQREATPESECEWAHADLEKARGDLVLSPSQELVSHKSSIRPTALALGLLFVVVSSMFTYQLYRTLTS